MDPHQPNPRVSVVGDLGRTPGGGRILLITAAFVIVVAGMREAQSVLVPFLLSGFIAIIAAPALLFLRAYKVPSIIAIILVILAIASTGLLLGVLVGNAVDDFSTQLPTYQAKLKTLTNDGLTWLSGVGVPVPQEILSKLLDPAKAMSMAAQGLSSLGGLLTNTFLILLTVVFILLEASSFPAKLHRILDNPEQSFVHFDQFIENIKRYMAIKTGTSLLTGIIIYVWLLVVGVDYPVLWGVIAFFLNYVPNIGSIIAAIPALLLALIQLGPAGTAWAGLGYILANNLVGNVIEPRFMGKGLGLSSLVVFLSLVFWGWVLGSVGMFLSVPLTMTIKIALDSNDDTRWLAILLGPEIEDEPSTPGKGGLLKGWRLPYKPNNDE
ncbi:AI-2E family transporter [Sedimenticola selenatireducens]|uniref:AI-2E family transporter n=1 Tax=Sedimenticola selenatireducens TaxID=191960 RepID=A0A558DSU3_9GAMM|nr:AI-2E family transporter [Sedimenticola selenatireducens]TVO76672.1 AI-2E family transporter [Sedimenticola selenatireducens]TVT64115.1 MAG: AI-2E family transporter [Sedimenticola selenatireducens]